MPQEEDNHPEFQLFVELDEIDDDSIAFAAEALAIDEAEVRSARSRFDNFAELDNHFRSSYEMQQRAEFAVMLASARGPAGSMCRALGGGDSGSYSVQVFPEITEDGLRFVCDHPHPHRTEILAPLDRTAPGSSR